MPPKKDSKTVVGAYTAKCTKCGKKHAPPLKDVCLALIDPAEDNGEVHINPDDDTVETLLGEAAAVDVHQHTDGTQQAQLSGQHNCG
jgi:hypothetical protein